jgi:hypothetical protein
VVRTTSRPARRAQGKGPIKGIRLKVTLDSSDLIAQQAEEKGMAVERSKGALSITFSAATSDEALEKLRVLSSLLSPKT